MLPCQLILFTKYNTSSYRVQLYYIAQAKSSYLQNLQNTFFLLSHISPSISILCQTILVENLSQRTFCDHHVHHSNVCRAISRITKIALLNNFLAASSCVLPAHDIIHVHVPLTLCNACVLLLHKSLVNCLSTINHKCANL